MKKLLLLLSGLIILSGCEKDPGTLPVDETKHTLFLYMPWATNLAPYFEQNIRDFETAIRDNILKDNRVVVFFSSSPTQASLFELQYENGKSVRRKIKDYASPAYTTEAGLTAILNDVVCFAPAENYAMVIGSHGMGWLPVPETSVRRPRLSDTEKYHWEHDNVPMTRYFGGFTPDTQTNITTLADAIGNAGVKMDYILFDDCYMSSIEVAYDLREVTDYLIASPTEVMIYGFPYHIIGKYLVGDYNLQGIVDGFYNFYANYTYPYGTIGVTDCSELDELAVIMKEINRRFSFDRQSLNDIQRMDGYSPVIFFDLKDYVRTLCSDIPLLNRFEHQMERVVPSALSRHTENYYSASRGVVGIDEFTGVAISDPSENSKAVAKTETSWYIATH